MTFWRAAGLSYVSYSNIAARQTNIINSVFIDDIDVKYARMLYSVLIIPTVTCGI